MQEEKETTQIQPQFMKEEVYFIECACCGSTLCNRGMKSFLVADEKVELYSTDQVDKCIVDVTDEEYKTDKCFCVIQNIGCLLCGNMVSYHVKQPCVQCLQSQNNGHYWMFYRAAVIPGSRLTTQGSARLLWGELPQFERDYVLGDTEECER